MIANITSIRINAALGGVRGLSDFPEDYNSTADDRPVATGHKMSLLILNRTPVVAPYTPF